jgi:glycolate oxidase
LGAKQVFLEETDRATYSYDAAVLEPVMPAIVLRPGSPEELGQVVRLCHENSLPLTVRGAGTNLSGGSIPGRGGAVVLTTALNKILEINEADLYAVVQPLVTADYCKGARTFCPLTLGAWRFQPGRKRGGKRWACGLPIRVTRDYVMASLFAAAGS